MPFRAVFAVPVVALLAVLGVWYQQRPEVPSPVVGAEDSVLFVEATILSISRWDAEPDGWGFYREGFNEIVLRLDTEMLWHSPETQFLFGPEAGSSFMVRTAADGYIEGERYGMFLYPPFVNDQLPLWIDYAHVLATDQPAPEFAGVESSEGRTALQVLDCLVDAGAGDTRLEAMRGVIVETQLSGQRAEVLNECENIG